MDLKLKDKVVIVTGGSKGIGLGIVQTLIQEQAIPFLVSRNEQSLAAVVAAFKKEGITLNYAVAELTDNAQCKAAIAEAIKTYGRIDGLVNNAGVAPANRMDLLETTEESYDRVLDINEMESSGNIILTVKELMRFKVVGI